MLIFLMPVVLLHLSQQGRKRDMKSFALKLLNRAARSNNMTLKQSIPDFPKEFSKDEIELIIRLKGENSTMCSYERLIATGLACKYVAERNIPGAFVECGVYRGGNSILASYIFSKMNQSRELFLFDTFAGMTEPSILDKSPYISESAVELYNAGIEVGHNLWCYASLEDVVLEFGKYDIEVSNINFIKGDVRVTLGDLRNLPGEISVLRLDTDFYDSTLAEMNSLYPLIRAGGVLLVDDYGFWSGAQQAIEDYFDNVGSRPMLHMTDYTGRSAIKI
jgi:O-methyltransferase